MASRRRDYLKTNCSCMEGSYGKIANWKTYRLLLPIYQCNCWADTWWRTKEYGYLGAWICWLMRWLQSRRSRKTMIARRNCKLNEGSGETLPPSMLPARSGGCKIGASALSTSHFLSFPCSECRHENRSFWFNFSTRTLSFSSSPRGNLTTPETQSPGS